MTDMTFSLFGPVRGWRAGTPVDLGPRQQKVVLTVLLLNAARVVPTSAIAEAIWGSSVPGRADNRVRVHVHRLRCILGVDAIESVQAGYVLHASTNAVDALRLRQSLQAARRCGTTKTAQDVADLLKQVIDEGFETPLTDVRGEYVTRQRESLHTLLVDAAEGLAELEIELGRSPAAILAARWALGLEPRRERLHELLVLAQYRSGSHAEANDSYQAAERLLREEFGAGPGPGLRSMRDQLLHLSAEPRSGQRSSRLFVERERA